MLLRHRLGKEIAERHYLGRPSGTQVGDILLTTPGTGSWTATFTGTGVVEVIGGGGGGAGGDVGVIGGGGGAGGGYGSALRAFTKGTVYAYTVGAGGAAVAKNTNGNVGGLSQMASNGATVIGFGGGAGAKTGTGGKSGYGLDDNFWNDDYSGDGGAGSDTTHAAGLALNGGGGGIAARALDEVFGYNGDDGGTGRDAGFWEPYYAGSGGDGGLNVGSVASTAGSSPGGGGGGGYDDGGGSKGGDGMIKIIPQTVFGRPTPFDPVTSTSPSMILDPLGDSDAWTKGAETVAITAVTDNGGVAVFAATAHGLSIADVIRITGTTDYNGDFTVSTTPDADSFQAEIAGSGEVAYVSNQSGTVRNLGAAWEAGATGAIDSVSPATINAYANDKSHLPTLESSGIDFSADDSTTMNLSASAVLSTGRRLIISVNQGDGNIFTGTKARVYVDSGALKIVDDDDATLTFNGSGIDMTVSTEMLVVIDHLGPVIDVHATGDQSDFGVLATASKSLTFTKIGTGASSVPFAYAALITEQVPKESLEQISLWGIDKTGIGVGLGS